MLTLRSNVHDSSSQAVLGINLFTCKPITEHLWVFYCIEFLVCAEVQT